MAPVAMGGALMAAGLAVWAVRGRSSTVFGPSVWRGDASRRAVALTFDDGPSESTERLLEILERHNARATFFQCGMHAERLPAIARAVSAAGHEIGNHTYSHPRLWLRPPGFAIDEIARAQRALEQIHGLAPRYFRPTYGVRWFGLRGALRRLGLESVMWTAIARDWTLDGPAIVRRMRTAARPGAILCFHDGRERSTRPDIGPTIAAVRDLLPALAGDGYPCVTLNNLLCPNQ